MQHTKLNNITINTKSNMKPKGRVSAKSNMKPKGIVGKCEGKENQYLQAKRDENKL